MKYRFILIVLLSLIFVVPVSFAQQAETPLNGAQSNLSQESRGTLKAEIIVNAQYGWPNAVILSGKVEVDEAWLGLSFYPYNVEDPVTGGSHQYIELKRGEFRKVIPVEAQHLDGSFEAALWAKKVLKVDSSEEYSYWDKMFGYHVEDMIVYTSGLLTQLKGYR